jgi:hypothetical protein
LKVLAFFGCLWFYSTFLHIFFWIHGLCTSLFFLPPSQKALFHWLSNVFLSFPFAIVMLSFVKVQVSWFKLMDSTSPRIFAKEWDQKIDIHHQPPTVLKDVKKRHPSFTTSLCCNHAHCDL